MNVANRLEKDFAKGNMYFGKMQGLSELNITLISVLFLNEEPVSIEELAKKTGYSLSAVSTAMKTLEILRKVIDNAEHSGEKKLRLFTIYTGHPGIADIAKKINSFIILNYEN